MSQAGAIPGEITVIGASGLPAYPTRLSLPSCTARIGIRCTASEVRRPSSSAGSATGGLGGNFFEIARIEPMP